VVQHDARLHRRRPRLGIHVQDAVQVLGAVEDQRLVHRLPALRGAAAARQDRHPLLHRDGDRRRHILRIARDDDADRLHLVDRRVGAVAPACETVEQHLPVHGAAQAGGQGAVTDAGAAARRGVAVVERHGVGSPETDGGGGWHGWIAQAGRHFCIQYSPCGESSLLADGSERELQSFVRRTKSLWERGDSVEPQRHHRRYCRCTLSEMGRSWPQMTVCSAGHLNAKFVWWANQ